MIVHDQAVMVSILLGELNIPVGRLWCHLQGTQESASFEYHKTWLEHAERFMLDPALTLTSGTFHTKQGIGLFGALGDSAPDRWGRMLMQQTQVAIAKDQGVTPRRLFEIDYLLGVHDEVRQGALRFSLPQAPAVFLSNKPVKNIPFSSDLSQLFLAIERLMADNASVDDLKFLLAPGSSLGGARPKAAIIDHSGHFAIAKFPKEADEFSTVVWEAVALTLAKHAGIHVPPYQLKKVLGKPVLIVNRFDRKGTQRIPFISAMSMLGTSDHAQHSYLEIADALVQYGAYPKADMAELWRRIVFNVMVANTDNHLRNHGFLYERCKGWRLSPIYDVNPVPEEIAPRILTTSIRFDSSATSLDCALSVIQDFRLKKVEALRIIEEVRAAVQKWPTVASTFGLSKKECERMASAFSYDETTIY